MNLESTAVGITLQSRALEGEPQRDVSKIKVDPVAGTPLYSSTFPLFVAFRVLLLRSGTRGVNQDVASQIKMPKLEDRNIRYPQILGEAWR